MQPGRARTAALQGGPGTAPALSSPRAAPPRAAPPRPPTARSQPPATQSVGNQQMSPPDLLAAQHAPPTRDLAPFSLGPSTA
eukprot:3889258-Rhodomonas_salina.1